MLDKKKQNNKGTKQMNPLSMKDPEEFIYALQELIARKQSTVEVREAANKLLIEIENLRMTTKE